jgi:dephospho-CoA kinase
MEGFWQKFFRVGTVYVETAGEQPNFRMTNIKHPIEVANSIMQIHEELVEEHELGEEFSDGVGMDMIRPVKKIIDEKNEAIAKDKKSKASPSKEEITPIYEYIGDEKVISIQDPKKKINSKSKSKPKNQEIKKISESSKKDDDKKFKIEKTWIDNTKNFNNIEDLDDLGGGEYVEDIDDVDGEIDEGEEIKF